MNKPTFALDACNYRLRVFEEKIEIESKTKTSGFKSIYSISMKSINNISWNKAAMGEYGSLILSLTYSIYTASNVLDSKINIEFCEDDNELSKNIKEYIENKIAHNKSSISVKDASLPDKMKYGEGKLFHQLCKVFKFVAYISVVSSAMAAGHLIYEGGIVILYFLCVLGCAILLYFIGNYFKRLAFKKVNEANIQDNVLLNNDETEDVEL